MTTFFKYLLSLCSSFGIDLRRLLVSIVNIPFYIVSLFQFCSDAIRTGTSLPLLLSSLRIYPILHNRSTSSGVTRGHYFHQDLYVAKAIYTQKPPLHLDIGSRVDGFIAHLLAFDQRLVVGDIRPLDITGHHIDFFRVDLTSHSAAFSRSFESISCLHSLEHFGLGRYGDPVDANGFLIGLANLFRLLSPGGTLYLSFPITTTTKSLVYFNAHRVINLSHALSLFNELSFIVQSFSFVDDRGFFFKNASFEAAMPHMTYGLGIFTLSRK